VPGGAGNPGRVASPDDELVGVARDATTILEVLDGFERAGYRGQFMCRADGEIECRACRQRFPAEAVGDAQLRRLEGASDPADMLAVAALTCPRCRVRGTLVLNYGPLASPEDAAVLGRLESSPPPDPQAVPS